MHRSKFDVLHSHLGSTLNAILVGTARLFGLPSVARMATGGQWNDFVEMRSWPKASLGPALAPLLKRADRFVVLTEESIPPLARDVPADRIKCIPNAIEPPAERWVSADLPRRRQELGLTSAQPFIFAAGRLVPAKGFDVLIRAVAAAGRPPLYLAGEGTEQDRLARQARELGVELHLLGKIPSANVSQWMLAASVVAAPSYIEGISNTVLEATTLGCPVVASRISGNLAVIDDGVTGLLVDAGDAEALANAITRLLGDDAAAAALGERARADVPARFGVEALVARYSALYEEVVRAHEKKSAS